MKKPVWVMALAALGLSACGKHSSPNFIYMPDMVYSPAIKAQEEGANRLPVKGTVSRDFTNYGFKKDDTEENLKRAGIENRNPLKPTREVFVRGQKMYNTYCIVCHGTYGEGDGTVVPKYPRPPSLQSEKIIGWPDGRIYHNITVGQNIMNGYGSQIVPEDRWAIVHYIRALQRAKHPSESDLKYAEGMAKR